MNHRHHHKPSVMWSTLWSSCDVIICHMIMWSCDLSCDLSSATLDCPALRPCDHFVMWSSVTWSCDLSCDLSYQPHLAHVELTVFLFRYYDCKKWPWVTSNPNFKVTPIFNVEYLRNGARYRHSYNEILIWTSLDKPPWRRTRHPGLLSLSHPSVGRKIEYPAKMWE